MSIESNIAKLTEAIEALTKVLAPVAQATTAEPPAAEVPDTVTTTEAFPVTDEVEVFDLPEYEPVPAPSMNDDKLYTTDDIRSLIFKITDKKACKDIIKEFGYAKVSDIKEEDAEKIYKKIQKLTKEG